MPTFRAMTESDIEAYIPLRLAQLREEGGAGPDLAPALRDYCRRHLADGSFFALFALEGERIIGMGGVSVVEKPPWYGCPGGRIGLLSSMYTLPDCRRRGVAREILTRLLDHARSQDCAAVHVTASEAGMKLYSACSFRPNGRFMEYRLQDSD